MYFFLLGERRFFGGEEVKFENVGVSRFTGRLNERESMCENVCVYLFITPLGPASDLAAHSARITWFWGNLKSIPRITKTLLLEISQSSVVVFVLFCFFQKISQVVLMGGQRVNSCHLYLGHLKYFPISDTYLRSIRIKGRRGRISGKRPKIPLNTVLII